jgi:phage-related protein
MLILKPLRWIGRSREDLRRFPDKARRNIDDSNRLREPTSHEEINFRA